MNEAGAAAFQDLRALRVLLLEDSRFDAELLREALLAAYPNAALQVVDDEPGFAAAVDAGGWDAILSDYELPGFSGQQALEHARAVAAETPFIFVSGVIGEDNAVEMLKRGATDYVSKSRLARLSVVLRRALREAAEHRELGRVEGQLWEANAVYERVVNSLRNYAVILLDREGRVTSWNRAATDIFGRTPDEMVGRSAESLFAREDRAAGIFARELATALATGAADDNRWMLRSDGLQLWAEGVCVPLYSAAREHSGFCKVVRDATADFRDAQALRAAKEQAERANEAKSRFLAILSHELRTPLTPISIAADVLERSASVPEKHQGLLPMIRRNVALEARLIDDLLDLTALAAGKVSLRVDQVDMHQLVGAVAEMLGEQLRAGELTLHLRLEAGQAVVDGDAARLQQVLWNVMRNAVKFTPRGGTIRIRTASTAQAFTMECTDTGIGIDAQALPHIFDAFEQADREVTRRFGGLGLGMAIAHGLVRQHQGELHAGSPGRDRGATFTLELPLSAAALGGDGTLPERGGEDGHGAHVLLVEDSPDAAETTKLVLETFGWRVTHVASCAAALARALEPGIDIVLTDLGLPDGSGIEIGRQLGASLPVVALSGYGAAADLRQSSMAGFADHLVKPADAVTLHKALEKALAARRCA